MKISNYWKIRWGKDYNILIFEIQFVVGIIVIGYSGIPEIGLGLILFSGFYYLGEVLKENM